MPLFRSNPLKISALRPNEVPAARALLIKNTAGNCLPGSRFEQLATQFRPGMEFAGIRYEKEIVGVLWHGVSVAILGMENHRLLKDPELYAAAGNYVVKQNRNYASVLGEPKIVQELWQVLSGRINPAREFRLSQPLMEARSLPKVPAHPQLRLAQMRELELVFPAAVAMFREEVGVDPLANGGGTGYHQRVRQLISQKSSYVVRDGEKIIFKADVGAKFSDCAQIQGVWVHPEYRGKKLASTAMAALIPLVQAEHAPRVTLYVNDFNQPARAAYLAAGFQEIGELATIMLS